MANKHRNSSRTAKYWAIAQVGTVYMRDITEHYIGFM